MLAPRTWKVDRDIHVPNNVRHGHDVSPQRAQGMGGIRAARRNAGSCDSGAGIPRNGIPDDYQIGGGGVPVVIADRPRNASRAPMHLIESERNALPAVRIQTLATRNIQNMI